MLNSSGEEEHGVPLQNLDNLCVFAEQQNASSVLIHGLVRKLLPSSPSPEYRKLEKVTLDLSRITRYLLDLLICRQSVSTHFTLKELNILVQFRNHALSEHKPLPLFKERRRVNAELIDQAKRGKLQDALLEEVSFGEPPHTERLVTLHSFVLGSAVLGISPKQLSIAPVRFSELIYNLHPNKAPAGLCRGFVGDSDKAYLGTLCDIGSGKMQLDWGVRPRTFLQLASDFDSVVGEDPTGIRVRRYIAALSEVVESTEGKGIE